MEGWDEEIKAHIVWIWGGKMGFFKRGREGMLVITNKRLAFITKTEMSYRVHDVYSKRQIIRFKENQNIFRPIEEYKIIQLDKDLENDNNIQIRFNQIGNLNMENKRWGTALIVGFNTKEKLEHYKFSIVKSWVKYPAKDPLQFYHVNWKPIINLINNNGS